MNEGIKLLKNFNHAVFKKRLNRFLVECEYKGSIVKAHLPNPGRLWELLQEGVIVYLSETGEQRARNTRYTVIAALKDSKPVFLHTHYTNNIARIIIEDRAIQRLEDYEIVKSEYTKDGSRFDFMLQRGQDRMLLEVKSCTLFHNNIAMFPDAVTSRGTKHLRGLAETSFQGGILFIVHSGLPEYFLPEYHIDPEFSKTLYDLRDKLSIWAVGIDWEPDLSIQKKVKMLTIPWYIFEKEAGDRGVYILVLSLDMDRRLLIGRLGEVFLKKGFYIYVGSAMQNLNKRLARHRKKDKRLFWHIDYLRKEAELVYVIPVITKERLECKLADSMRRLSNSPVDGFGSTDCRCDSHLFYMKENPICDNRFIELLLDYRMPYISNQGQKIY